MSYLDRLLQEVSEIRRTFGVEPERPTPTSVQVVDSPPSLHSTSSLSKDGVLLLSSKLLQHVDKILKKEALSLFIPPQADEVPQVHDLAWAYSEVPAEIWEQARVKAPRPFDNYDPATLFSLLTPGSRRRVIRDTLLYVKASAARGQLTLPLYLYMLNRFFGRELRLTDAERRIIEVLSVNPYANTREIKEKARVSEASISRSLRKLRAMGYLFGPENVKLWKLGLITLIASFPNERRYREAFWRFPFTYTQAIPVSGEGRVHAYLVVPRPSLGDLLRLQKVGVELGIVKRTVQRFNFTPPRNPLAAMARAYLGSEVSGRLVTFEPEPPPIRLSKKDIRVLNHIMREGRATSSSLRRKGIKSAKQRLGKLRSSGILGSYYMVELPMGYEVVLFRVSCSHDEVERFASTLAAVTTTAVNYVEGREHYCLALTFSPRELKSDLVRGVKAIYGDDVELAEDVMDIHPSWLLPEDLWDEGRQVFRWEVPLEELLTELRRI